MDVAVYPSIKGMLTSIKIKSKEFSSNLFFDIHKTSRLMYLFYISLEVYTNDETFPIIYVAIMILQGEF